MKIELENLIIWIMLIAGIICFPFMLANTPSNNYENVTVPTKVNITNSRAQILLIHIDEGISPTNTITLKAGGTRTVYCNVTVRDYNGIDNNISVNATFFYFLNKSQESDDNNTHYTNSSCNLSTVYGQNNIYGNYTCAFNVWYFANNGTWNCSAIVLDKQTPSSFNYTHNNSNSTIVNPLYALNVSDGIDYGGIAVGDTSNNITADVNNFGNMNINITLQGYGITTNDGLAMNCTTGNITIDNEKFSINGSAGFTDKTALDGSTQLIGNFTIPKPIITSTPVNTTYWQLQIPISTNPSGNCTGNILFAATAGS